MQRAYGTTPVQVGVLAGLGPLLLAQNVGQPWRTIQPTISDYIFMKN
jgi:hypothetical protein